MTQRKPTILRSAQPTSAGGNSGLPTWLALMVIALVTCAAYWPAMQGDFLWDDDGHVTKPELQPPAGLARIWFEVGATQQYYPLLHTAFWLEHRLWGDQSVYYHRMNLLEHIAAAGLVYVILRKLNIPGPLLAAAIFALHPVQVETVAWITEQKNTLSAVFYLSAMLAYLYFDETRKGHWYGLALGLFVLGLLSKTVTATLPAALLVIFWCERGRLSWRRDVLPLIPFFVLGIIAGLFSAWVEQKLIGAEGEEYNLTVVERGLLAGRVIWFYLAKLVWPANLIFIYPRWTIDPTQASQWFFPLGALAMLAALWAVRRRWRAPLAGYLYFVGTLFPVLGFLNVYPFRYSFVADHFQYLASLGIIVPVSAGITLAIGRLSPPLRIWGTALCVLLVAVLATLTWQQSHLYGGDVAHLYEKTIEKNPACWMAYNNLGMTYFDQGKASEAMDRYRQALALKPDYPEAEYNLGNALARTGHVEAGLAHLQRAVELRPSFADAYNNIGGALVDLGRPQAAIEHLNKALSLKPIFPEAYNNLGNALTALGRPQEAIGQYEQALRCNPDHATAHHNLGAALLNTGQVEQAVEHLARTVQLRPDDAEAWVTLGIAHARLQHQAAALAATQRGLALARAQGLAPLAKQAEDQLSTLLTEKSPVPNQPSTTPLPAKP